MPRGRSTPLGRQLRTVLANFCPSSPLSTCHLTTSDHFHSEPLYFNPNAQRRFVHHGSRRVHVSHSSQQSTAATARVPTIEHVVERGSETIQGNRSDKPSWRRLNRRTHVDHIALALCSNGVAHSALQPPTGKKDLSHVDVKSRHRWHDHDVNRRRHADDIIRNPLESQELRLPRLVANAIRHSATRQDEKESSREYAFAPYELEYIRSAGYESAAIFWWAKILSAENAFDAAQLLSQWTSEHGPSAIPTFVYMQLLRRTDISPRAFRLIFRHMIDHIDAKLGAEHERGRFMPSLFLACVRLIRHAREVWPQAFPSIVDLFIRHLEHKHNVTLDPHIYRHARSLAVNTYWLNQLMSLVSMASAVLPFKDNVHQEAAITRLLRFMADHDPPLHPNRTGYRAVIRLQLAQPKSSGDRLWAELKSLSWPPWKVNRTGMDEVIGLEQGMSRAFETLRQMQNAGYALLDWEKGIQAYAGWDVDGTPAIQTRTLVPVDVPRFSRTSAKWVARIETTRTVQEAWACYLAWEDLRLPSDQSVYLAIFKRLFQEERRQHKEQRGQSPNDHSEDWSLLPGDSQEISPLPPSTHLYTYTRTKPPSVNEFYDQLHGHGVHFSGHLLAFVVANANNLQTGIHRLENGVPQYPDIRAILSLDTALDLSAIPTEVFDAAVKLFCRFARVMWSEPELHWDAGHHEKPGEPLLDGHQLNRRHLIIHTLELLKVRRTHFRPSWNAVLEGLSRESNLMGMRRAIVPGSETQHSQTLSDAGMDLDYLERCGGALTAYRLVRRTLSMTRDLHIDLDMPGFRYLCLATENLAVAVWSILCTEPNTSLLNSSYVSRAFTRYTNEAKSLLRSNSHEERLKGEFRILVGADASAGAGAASSSSSVEPSHTAPTSAALPRLLTIPSPALLHAYVRALGWLGDHDGLHSLVQWMREYWDELSARMARDRTGEAMMRRTLVAIRVFLERSWLPLSNQRVDRDDCSQVEGNLAESAEGVGRGQKILQRLRCRAAPDTIVRVKHMVESNKGWDGWPSDEEVEAYCQDARFGRVW